MFGPHPIMTQLTRFGVGACERASSRIVETCLTKVGDIPGHARTLLWAP